LSLHDALPIWFDTPGTNRYIFTGSGFPSVRRGAGRCLPVSADSGFVSAAGTGGPAGSFSAPVCHAAPRGRDSEPARLDLPRGAQSGPQNPCPAAFRGALQSRGGHPFLPADRDARKRAIGTRTDDALSCRRARFERTTAALPVSALGRAAVSGDRRCAGNQRERGGGILAPRHSTAQEGAR